MSAGRLLGTVARACVAWLVAGCASVPAFDGTDVSSGQSLTLVPGRMAAGHSFSGSYWSPQSGQMHLLQRDDALEGQYEYRWCGCRVHGRLSGKVEGNLARVELSEQFSGCNTPRALDGRGYLFYRTVPLSDTPAQLFGARAFLAPPPLVSTGAVREERPRTGWTAFELDPRDPVTPDDESHCP